MHVAALHSYPLKASYRLDHDGADVDERGLAGDRCWIVVDEDGELVGQPDAPRLGQVRTVTVGDSLILRVAGQPDLTVDAPSADADAWLSLAVDRKVRLVRRMDGGEENPLLLTTAASLGALNDYLLESGSPEGPLPMTRFRPNVVVAGSGPWVEDGWLGGRLRIGDVVFRVTKACERCVITTYDPETGERGREPLRVLARLRNIDHRLLFGVYLAPEGAGRLSVGDPVSVVA
jgi:uncharacterized protein YcbX